MLFFFYLRPLSSIDHILTTVFSLLACSARKTMRWEARLAAGPDLMRPGSCLAMALVKLFTRKKSAPPWPRVLAGGATRSGFTVVTSSVRKSWSRMGPSAPPRHSISP